MEQNIEHSSHFSQSTAARVAQILRSGRHCVDAGCRVIESVSQSLESGAVLRSGERTELLRDDRMKDV